MSGEWRLTYHPLGDGAKVGKYDRTKDEYLHISTYGLNSKNHKDDTVTSVGTDTGNYDRAFYGVLAVYNNPMFLLAGQVFTAKDDYAYAASSTNKTHVDYKGWSLNGEIRPMTDWTIIARYDKHTKDTNYFSAAKNSQSADQNDATQLMYGVAYKYNKNLTFIASAKNIKDNAADIDTTDYTKKASKDVYMLTTEVKW